MTARFAVDRMLGRLAKLLRLLGYDTLYSAQMTPAELQSIASESSEPKSDVAASEEAEHERASSPRIVLTRGHPATRFAGLVNVYSVHSEYPPEQLLEVIRHFNLDTRSGLFTRCTLCNARLVETEKASVQAQVPAKAWAAYQEFFRCAGCGHVYWKGSHAERILKNLEMLLGGG